MRTVHPYRRRDGLYGFAVKHLGEVKPILTPIPILRTLKEADRYGFHLYRSYHYRDVTKEVMAWLEQGNVEASIKGARLVPTRPNYIRPPLPMPGKYA